MSRKDFYNSKVWELVRVNYAKSKCCICERCGQPVYVSGVNDYLPKEKRIRYIVHHKTRLNEINYNDDSISLNEDNLELLCIDCHNKEHFGSMAVRKDLMFDEFGNLVKRKVVKRKQ